MPLLLSDAEKFKEEFEAAQATLQNKEDKLTQDMEKLTMDEENKVRESEREELRRGGLSVSGCVCAVVKM